MKFNKIFSSLLLFSIILNSCSEKKDERPKTAIETGRAFIKACLNGDFETSENLILKDDTNTRLFNTYKDFYNKMSTEQKNNYKNASYEINKLEEVNDSITIINYSNDYMKKPMEIKIIRRENIWSVDFKYTYSENFIKN